MNSSEQTISRIERALRKAASKFPSDADSYPLTDLYLVDDETIMISGDLMEGLGEDLDRFWEDLSKK